MLETLNKACESSNATLVAVSKTKPNSKILDLYQKGQRVFGENRVQELVDKHESLPKDIEWHMIGHLQKNKVKYIAPFIDLIHSVDSLALLQTIEKEGAKNNRVIPVLLQVKIATEASKFGSDDSSLIEMVEAGKTFNHVEIKGLMGMATFTDDMEQVRQEFRFLKQTFDKLKATHLREIESFTEISMGMSGDYKIALEEGSTMIRVGSLLFGAR